jgi:hypothetical protein
MEITMSDSKSGGVPLARLADLALSPEACQKAQESLWKSYGSKENWEEFKAMAKQLAQQEKQIAELREQVELLDLQNQALLLEWARLTKGKVN